MNVAEAPINQTYAGWSNYETWLVNMWLTSDEGYYEQLLHVITSFGDVSDQAEALQEWIQLEFDELEVSNMWRDVLSHALWRVDWYQVADNNQL